MRNDTTYRFTQRDQTLVLSVRELVRLHLIELVVQLKQRSMFSFTIDDVNVHAAGMGVTRRTGVQACVCLDRSLNEQTAGSHGSPLRDQADTTPRRVEGNRLRNKEDGQRVALSTL